MFFIIPRHTINFSAKEKLLLIKGLLANIDGSDSASIAFERAFSQYIGTKYAFAVSSARMALFLILNEALKIRPDDEVILPAYSFWAVVEVIKTL